MKDLKNVGMDDIFSWEKYNSTKNYHHKLNQYNTKELLKKIIPEDFDSLFL